LYACLASGVAIAAALGACAAPGKGVHESGDGGGAFDDSGAISFVPDGGAQFGDAATISFVDSSFANSSCSSGLTSIAVSPAATPLTLTYSATQTPLTQALTAQGTFMDGSTQDVTTCAVWTVTPEGPATAPTTTVTGGAFSTTSPGAFTVTAGATASSGSTTVIKGTATITVTLTGTVNASAVSTTALDGTPSGTAPTIAYPLDGSLFPLNFGDLGWQVIPSSATFTTGRIAFQGDVISLNVYAPCTPIADPTSPNACSIAIPTALEADLANASESANLTETVRVSDGTNVAESSPISVRWASNPLVGSIYYWSTPAMGSTAASEVIRMNLATPGTPPEVFITEQDVIPYAELNPPNNGPLSGDFACIGCHSISPDGTKLGITIGGAAVTTEPDGTPGGGNGSWFALIDVANKIPISAAIINDMSQLLPSGFAEITTFSSTGDDMVQTLQGQLFLRTADANLTSTGPLFGSMKESMTQPYWSYNGDLLTFASWVPDTSSSFPHTYDPEDINGNEIPNAQIWTAPATGTTFGTPSVLVPRTMGLTEYYPTISEDSALVAFDESSCSGPATPSADGYGASPCDSYDDPSAHLRLVAASGGTPVDLDKASQRTSGWPTTSTWTNSWPRFAPPAPTGTPPSTFQGKTLYWIAFSSRLPYGATLAGSQSGTTPPQIWLAAVAVDPSGTLSGDPSFAPVWLPQQNSATPEILINGTTSQTLGGNGKPTGNHVPQWVYKYVPYTPPPPPPNDAGVYIPPPPK
jgi:hypothetical protein